jgi:hypothetical protein
VRVGIRDVLETYLSYLGGTIKQFIAYIFKFYDLVLIMFAINK